MLVLCVGMYRACSTWQYGVVGQLIERRRDGARLGFVEGIYFDQKLGDRPHAGSWATLKAHDAHPRFAEELAAGRAWGIYSYRDLRDVAFSYAHKTGTTFEDLAARDFFDLVLENDRFWRARPRMLVQSYEALIAEPERGVEQIAAHLEIELEPGEARAIAESLSFTANKRRIDQMAGHLRDDGVALADHDQSRFDPVSLLHWNHMRSGGAGGWRQQATPRQLATIARVGGPWLIAHGYEADDSWAPDPSTPEADPAPLLQRTSHAARGEDIRLDRLFRGRKGTFLHLDADHPVARNLSYFFYERGWRGANIGTAGFDRGRFVADRPNDLNIACRLGASQDPMPEGGWDYDSKRTLAGLIAEFRLAPPEFLALDASTDADLALPGLPLDTWQPEVVAIAVGPDPATPAGAGPGEAVLVAHGYTLGVEVDGTRYYLRADRAERAGLLANPLGPDDRMVAAGSAADGELIDLLHDRVAHAIQAGEASGDLAMFQAERDAWQRERDAVQAERDMLQRERDATQRERDWWQEQRDGWQGQRDGWQRERDWWQGQRDGWQEQRDAWQGERDAWQGDRDAHQQALADNQAAEAAWVADRAGLRAEADAVAVERDHARAGLEALETLAEAWRADRLGPAARAMAEPPTPLADRLAAEFATVRDERIAREVEIARDLAARDRDHAALRQTIDHLRAELEGARARLDAAFAHHHAERSGWSAERQGHEGQAAELRGQLRPYRLLDRLGLAIFIHRRARRLKHLLVGRDHAIGGRPMGR